MINLTEENIDEIREAVQRRRVLRQKLEILTANEANFDHVHIRFESKDAVVDMKQGRRGGLMGDMLVAFQMHLKEQIGVLTQRLEDLGVKIA